jgi:hypothetical protein
MVRASRDSPRRPDTFPSLFPLPVNRATLSQRNTLHTMAIMLEGEMAFDERTSGQTREHTAPRRPVFRFRSARRAGLT